MQGELILLFLNLCFCKFKCFNNRVRVCMYKIIVAILLDSVNVYLVINELSPTENIFKSRTFNSQNKQATIQNTNNAS